MATKEITPQDLAGFYGSQTFTRHGLFRKLVYTEGVKYLAENAGAYWLLDLIASHQLDKKVARQEFQVWMLELNEDGGALAYVTNGNTKRKIVSQEIPYTDFPKSLGPKFELWAELGSVDGVNEHLVLMLPSER